jgi:hypothetical protein
MFCVLGGAAGSDEEVGALDRGFAAGQGEMQDDGFAGGAFDTRQGSLRDNLDAVVVEELLEAFDDIGIFAVGDAGVALDDGDAGAETPHGLGEFEADESASKNEEMFGKHGEREGFDVGEWGRFGEAGNGFDGSAGAGGEEDAVGTQGARAAVVQGDFNSLFGDEAAEAHHDLGMAFGVVGEVDLQIAVDQLLAAGVDACHIDAPAAVDHAELGAALEILSYLGAVDDVLAWQAGDVGAGSADALVLDVDDALPLRPEGP